MHQDLAAAARRFQPELRRRIGAAAPFGVVFVPPQGRNAGGVVAFAPLLTLLLPAKMAALAAGRHAAAVAR